MHSFLLSILFLTLTFNFSSVNSTFQSSFFAAINKDYQGKNLIISPSSIYQILGLTANGAQGDTQKEMLEVLGNSKISKLNEINYDIIEAFKEFTTVELANAIMTKFDPEDDFVEIAEKYLAPIEPLEGVDQINEWCSEKTHGKIKEIIKELSSDVQMILINAIYFKGEWSHKFISDLTKKRPFYNFGLEENEKSVDTMAQTEHFNYYENSEVQAVELFYKKDGMSAVIILPQKEININDYIESLKDGDKLDEIVEGLDYAKVDLHLPKFKTTFESSLVKVLKSMGMKIAFTDEADFYAMRDSDIPLKIGEVIHKTFLEVNEEGTEAAAVTIVKMMDGAMPGMREEKIYIMDVDRPFLFLLKNRNLPKGYEFMFMSKIEEIE